PHISHLAHSPHFATPPHTSPLFPYTTLFRSKKLSPWAPRGSSLPNFFCAPATVRGAMRSSIAPGDPRCSGFVLRPAGTRWSEFCNGNGAGSNEPLGLKTEARGKRARSVRR